ncbi:MAG: hypothetical protein FIA99_04965 [Ruminiclostridium sp.]|nr:hypothetical protein [Ruminiclostridium sp.]
MPSIVLRLIKMSLIFLILTMIFLGCNQVTKSIKFDKLVGISNKDIQAIILMNSGDGSRIILQAPAEIEAVISKLKEFDFILSTEKGMTLSYSVKIVTDSASQSKTAKLYMNGSFAEFAGNFYTISKDKAVTSIDTFFESQFEKRLNLGENNLDVTLERLIGIELAQVKDIVLTKLQSSTEAEIRSLKERKQLLNFLQSIRLRQVRAKQVEDWAEIEEPSLNVSLSLNPDDPDMTINVLFVGNLVCIGTNYWYDIVSDNYDISFFKTLSSYF